MLTLETSFIIILCLILVIALFYYWQSTIWPRLPLKQEDSSHFAEVNGYNIHYKKAGQGEPLVLLHGIGASVYSWRFLVPLLSQNYQVIYMDLLGFGKSDKPRDFSYNLEEQAEIVDLFLKKINIKKARLVGSSMGGGIALWMSLKYPQNYQQLFLLSPAVNPVHTKRLNLKMANLFRPNPNLYLKPIIMKQMLKRIVNNHTLINNEMIKAYSEPFLYDPLSVPAFISAFENGLKDSRMPYVFSGLNAEVHLLWGTSDKMTKYKYAQELLDLLGNATLHTLKGGAHHLMEDSPEWTAKIITQTLDHSVEVSQ